MATIRIKTGPNKGKNYDLQDTPLTVGREDNQIIQILDQGVSRAHAEIFRLGEMCFIRDLNSTNGTFVNDVKITEGVADLNSTLLTDSKTRKTVQDYRKAPSGPIKLPSAVGANP